MLSNSQKLLTAAVVAAAALAGAASQSHAAIVINEVYGGGGSSSTSTTYAYSQDFVELYNNDASTPVDLTGMTLLYASATGSFTTTGTATTFTNVALPSETLAPLSYYLIAGAYSSSYKGGTLTGYDQTSSLSLAATAGKLELLAADGTTVLDLVGYGSTATTYEGTGPALGAGNTASVSRTLGVDTNNNHNDFTAGTPSPQGGGASAVPEPATLGIAALGASMLLTRRRR